MTDGLSMSSSWATTGTGSERASAAVSGGRIWLRSSADIRPGSGRTGDVLLQHRRDQLHQPRPRVHAEQRVEFFMGYRFGIFNYATQALGGAVTVRSFDLTTP